MMPEQTYPVFYNTQRMTLAQLRTRFAPGCHPEVWRCVEALIVWGRGRWGIGGGGRRVQPTKPGFAPRGMSFHEWQQFISGLIAYSAFDMVMTVPGGNHRAPTWTEAREVEQFGLHMFISGEPWHMQRRMFHPELRDLIRGFRSWVTAGRPDPDHFPLPVAPGVPAPPPLAPDLPYAPPSTWWLFPLDRSKPTLRAGSADTDVIGHVRYLQDAIWFGAGGDIHRDGMFGRNENDGGETGRRVRDLQRDHGLEQDEIVGPRTWAAVDSVVAKVVASNRPPAPAPENYGVTAVAPCLYFVQKGDGPRMAGIRVYGSAKRGEELLPMELFRAPFVHIPIPEVAGLTTAVRDTEGPLAVLSRFGAPRTALEVFYDWNGGPRRTLHPGDVVHIPTEAAR